MSDSDSNYAAAGVNIGAGQEAVRLMRPFAQSTYNSRVLGDIGGFGGLFKLDSYREPILVASTDGVGTKINIAMQAGSFAGVGADLVNHCINDIWVQGADPLFFMDYIAADKLNPPDAADLVRGMAEACSAVGCALIGGETAEMPGTYREGHYDVAGFIVGAVERWDLIDGSGIREGDVLVGLPSSGLHTNGYSLARRVFDLDDHPERLSEKPTELGGETLGDALLAIHRPYYHELKPVRRRIRGLIHITGGGYQGQRAARLAGQPQSNHRLHRVGCAAHLPPHPRSRRDYPGRNVRSVQHGHGNDRRRAPAGRVPRHVRHGGQRPDWHN